LPEINAYVVARQVRRRVQLRRAAKGDGDLFPVAYADEWRFQVDVSGLRQAGPDAFMRARVKCSGALANDRASDDPLGIEIAPRALTR
jgi:hypothetical protein